MFLTKQDCLTILFFSLFLSIWKGKGALMAGRVYSQKLGLISDEQFQAALDQFHLGLFRFPYGILQLADELRLMERSQQRQQICPDSVQVIFKCLGNVPAFAQHLLLLLGR